MRENLNQHQNEEQSEVADAEATQEQQSTPEEPEVTPATEIVYRPDPRFKLRMVRLAESLGIIVRTAELPQTGIADLVFELPNELTRLVGTFFEFLQIFKFVIVDFKGENDNLTMKLLQLNISRTAAFAAENERTPVRKILNLIISSRFPAEVIRAANADPQKPELIQQPGKSWLWRSSSYVQEVAIVVCRDLPISPEYFDLLLFAPVNTETWKRFTRTILDQALYDYIDESFKLHPKEMREMRIPRSEYWNDLDPREQERLTRDWMYVFQEEMTEWAQNDPEKLRNFMQIVWDAPVGEQIIQEIPTEKLVKAMPTEKVVKVLPPEQMVEAVSAEKLLDALSPEKLEDLKKLIAEREKANKPDIK
jgi:hypothetical protein